MPIAASIYHHAYQSGEGRLPIVLVHGAGGQRLSWPAEIRRLAGYRVFALDLPGHGRSGGHGQQSAQGYARAILDWMEALELRQAVFVGHSMGGAIALSLALDLPEAVLGLGLIGAGARLRVRPDILESLASEVTFQAAVRMILSASFSPSTPSRLVELAGARLAETRPSVLLGDFLACDGFDVMERVADVRQPTLVLCGAEDQMTPPRYAQFLAARIPGARLEIVPEAGHMVMLEQPRRVAGALKAFLDAIPGPPAGAAP